MLILALASHACGQPPGELAGPTVQEAARPPSLVQRDYAGHVRRLEVTPEEAAVEIIQPAAAAREAIDRILAQRAAVLDRFVFENLVLLQQIGTATAAGDKLGALRLVLDAAEKLRPLRDAGPLRRQIEAVLPPADRARFGALLDEYWRAVIADRCATPKPGGGTMNRFEAGVAERLEAFGREIERTFKRRFGNAQTEIDFFIRYLDLSPEQEAIIREQAETFYEKHGQNPPKKERDLFFLQVMAQLNHQQQMTLLKLISQQGAMKGDKGK